MLNACLACEGALCACRRGIVSITLRMAEGWLLLVSLALNFGNNEP